MLSDSASYDALRTLMPKIAIADAFAMLPLLLLAFRRATLPLFRRRRRLMLMLLMLF